MTDGERPAEVDNLAQARHKELVDQLLESDRYIDLDLMAEIMDQGEPIVDPLIAIMEQEDDWAATHAMLMLIEMRAERALPAVAKTLIEDPDLSEWLDTEGLDKFGPVAIDTLESMVTNDTADWYTRATAANALVNLAARHPDTYSRVTAILRSTLPDIDAGSYDDEDPNLWSAIATDLVTLRDPDAYELISNLLDGGFIDPWYMGRKAFEEGYRQTDPLYGVRPEPADLLTSHRAMQEHWRRVDARVTAREPLRIPLRQQGPARIRPEGTRKARKEVRKAQKRARRKQRRHKKKRR